MTSLDDRRDSFERKFAQDEELRFKAIARRNKLLGLWAAEKLGKSGTDADAYARSVVLADVQAAGDADVLRRVTADLASAGVGEADVRATMDRLLAESTAEIAAGR